MNPSESKSSPQEPSGLQVELGAKPKSVVRAVWLVPIFVFIVVDKRARGSTSRSAAARGLHTDESQWPARAGLVA